MNCVRESRVLKMPEHAEISEFRKKHFRNKHSTTIGTPGFEKQTTTLNKSTNAECNQKYSKKIILEINIRTLSSFCIQKTKQPIQIELQFQLCKKSD